MVYDLGLKNSIWAIVLPGAINVYYMVIMRTFFQGIPEELHQSAYVDGANDLRVFLQIILPISSPVIATMFLFYAVGHWNSFMPALLYLDHKNMYPVQLILRNIVISGTVSDSATSDVAFMTQGVKYAGILSATGGAEIGVTAASATAITFDEVMDLYYSLRSPYRKSAVFIMNDSTVKALRKLKNGNGDYIWQPSVTAGTPDTILNRPVYTSSFVPTLEGSAKPILFGDMHYYWIADREGRRFQRLNELYAPNGQVGFLSSERVDGKLILPEAVKCLQMKAA